jgi:hypothetical protein
MGRSRRSNRCQVCRHPDKWRIELLRAGGASLDALANKFGVDRDSIWRHWHRHVSPEEKAGRLAGLANMEHLAMKAAQEGDSVLDYLRVVRGTLLTQLSTMAVAGDSRNVAYVAGQLTKTLEAIGRVTGELGALATSQTFNVMNNVAVLQDSPVFAKLQMALLQALAPFPDARAAVVAALRALDDDAHTATPAPANGKLLKLEAAHVN